MNYRQVYVDRSLYRDVSSRQHICSILMVIAIYAYTIAQHRQIINDDDDDDYDDDDYDDDDVDYDDVDYDDDDYDDDVDHPLSSVTFLMISI